VVVTSVVAVAAGIAEAVIGAVETAAELAECHRSIPFRMGLL
jgi:hypothetical protein